MKTKVAVILTLAVFGAIAFAQQVETNPPSEAKTEKPSPLSEREETRRQEAIFNSRKAIAEGEKCLTAGEFERALQKFQYALDNISPNGATKADYERAESGFADVKARQAYAAFRERKLDQASTLIAEALKLRPNNSEYREIAGLIDEARQSYDAQRKNPEAVENNPAITPEFVEKIRRVQQLFYQGDRYFETGQYDKAEDRYTQILAIDPYNKGARTRLERLERHKMYAEKKAHETAKKDAMANVTAHWSEQVPADYGQAGKVMGTSIAPSNVAKLTRKLRDLKISELKFTDAAIEDVVNYIAAKTREADPSGEGINFVLKTKPTATPVTTGASARAKRGARGTTDAAAAAPAAPVVTEAAVQAFTIPPVTLQVSNLSVQEALQFLCNYTNMKYKIEEYAVIIMPQTDTSEILLTRTFDVPADFIPAATPPPSKPGFSTVESTQVDVKKALTDMGVQFQGVATAVFLPGSSKLVVKNTPEQMDVIEELIKSRETLSPLIEIETKFAEFTEDALKELSTNYFLAPGDLNIGSITALISQMTTTRDFAVGAQSIPGDPTNANIGKGGVWTALRNGRYMIDPTGGGNADNTYGGFTPNGVDSLLQANQGTNPPLDLLSGVPLGLNTPNTFSLGFQIGPRALVALFNLIDQVKGVDLLSAPKVVSKSGSPAKINISRQLYYPSKFEKPTAATTQSTFDGNNIILVLPSTPSDFVSKDVGVTMDVTPTADADGKIDLQLKPQVIDFEGFINYGVSIFQGDPVFNLTGGSVTLMTSNIVNQPVFNNRSIQTRLQVEDGNTVVMGGLIREDVQKIRDKIPVLGDMPVIGRFFQSNVDKSLKKNLLIFVTARLMRADGKPRYTQMEAETLAQPTEFFGK